MIDSKKYIRYLQDGHQLLFWVSLTYFVKRKMDGCEIVYWSSLSQENSPFWNSILLFHKLVFSRDISFRFSCDYSVCGCFINILWKYRWIRIRMFLHKIFLPIVLFSSSGQLMMIRHSFWVEKAPLSSSYLLPMASYTAKCSSISYVGNKKIF